MARRPRRTARCSVHPSLEVLPALLGDLDIRVPNNASVLSEDVQKDDQIAGPTVEHPIELSPIVASKLSQLPSDLRAVRKRKMRVGETERVESADLIVEGDLPFWS